MQVDKSQMANAQISNPNTATIHTNMMYNSCEIWNHDQLNELRATFIPDTVFPLFKLLNELSERYV